eukprot:COSAG05_NODE_21973_length_268_cov_0.609467_1_plen_81_part_00
MPPLLVTVTLMWTSVIAFRASMVPRVRIQTRQFAGTEYLGVLTTVFRCTRIGAYVLLVLQMGYVNRVIRTFSRTHYPTLE